MTTLLTVLLVIACFLVVAAVLLQPAKGGTSAFGAGSAQSLFGSNGATTFLFKIAMWGGFFIMATCLTLSIIRSHQSRESVIDLGAEASAPAIPSATQPNNPATAPTPVTTPSTTPPPAAEKPSK